MQSSSEQPLVGEERYVTTLITAAKETNSSGDLMRINFTIGYVQFSLSNLCSAKLTG